MPRDTAGETAERPEKWLEKCPAERPEKPPDIRPPPPPRCPYAGSAATSPKTAKAAMRMGYLMEEALLELGILLCFEIAVKMYGAANLAEDFPRASRYRTHSWAGSPRVWPGRVLPSRRSAFMPAVASFINAQTCNLKLTQKLLGHLNLSTTADIYTHTPPKQNVKPPSLWNGQFTPIGSELFLIL